jgi:hypothetical protein
MLADLNSSRIEGNQLKMNLIQDDQTKGNELRIDAEVLGYFKGRMEIM